MNEPEAVEVDEPKPIESYNIIDNQGGIIASAEHFEDALPMLRSLRDADKVVRASDGIVLAIKHWFRTTRRDIVPFSRSAT